MTPEAIERFFASYADAFSRRDVDTICGLWAFPAAVIARGHRASLDADAFRQNTLALCSFYDARGMAKAHKEVIGIDTIFPGLHLVRTADRMTDSRGREIAAWEHAYLLSETNDGLRAVVAMPDAELDTWQKRGTPLGSW